MKNICPNCREENEEKYEYCKNCGTPIDFSAELNEEPELEKATIPEEFDDRGVFAGETVNHLNNGEKSIYSDAAYPQFLGATPVKEYEIFIGKNAREIVLKLRAFLCGKKVNVCWPPALLSLLMGPIGTAFWCFYRKMYKMGVVFAAIAFLSFAANDLFVPSRLQIIATWGISLLSALISGLFSYGWYYRFSKKKITSLRSRHLGGDDPYFHYALEYTGGTSLGSVMMLSFLCIVCLYLPALIMYLN